MKKTISKFAATAALAVVSVSTGFAQANLGESCGCPPVASRPTVNLSTLAVSGGATDGDLTAVNTVLTCDKTYILDKKIYVPDGKSITIKAGTVIKGNPSGVPGDATALIVTRGGKIFATGSQDCPIVFTAAADPMDGTFGIGQKGLWGGVVILGKAKNNLLSTNVLGTPTNGVGYVEGFTSASARNLYGMPAGSEDDNDNSGIMEYVSIRHGGATVGPDNELNGLTLASVGRGTTINHIEVIANNDDGIEMFGGTVDIKYAVVMFNLDDAFDWDQGWTGKGQFWLLVQIAGSGDNGFECDGDDDKTNALPRSHPFVYNATCLGNGGDVGIEAKEITEGEIYNSVFANFGNGLNLIKALGTRTGTVEAYHNWIAGSLKVNNCTFVGTTNPIAVDGGVVNLLGSDQTKFTADGNVAAASVAGLDFGFVINGVTNAVTDQYSAVPTPALATSITPPADGFFSPAPYRGAFASNEKSWMSDWALAQLLGATKGLVDCPTDINVDGITNNVDFLQLLGKFNQSCN